MKALHVLVLIGVLSGSASAGQRLYVRPAASGAGDGSSWNNALGSLQSALTAAAGSGGTVTEIWTAAGIYKPASSGASRSSTFTLVSGVALYGGFAGNETALAQRDPIANLTTLSGDLAGDDGSNFSGIADNVYHVLTANGLSADTRIDGLTVTGGNTSGAPQTSGAAAYITGNSALAIANCRFRGNSAYNGGALYIASGSTPTIQGCAFIHNQATGSLNNYPSGGAIATGSSGVIISDCLFEKNQAASRGGAYFNSSQSVGTGLMQNCIFVGNTAENGGAVSLYGPSHAFVSCVFSGNGANVGGGVYAVTNPDSTGGLTLINCTIASNSGSTFCGGVYTSAAKATLTNCILWGNLGPNATETAQLAVGAGSLTVNYSRVMDWSGSWGGNGNSGADPRLVNPAGIDGVTGTSDDDLRILPGSACIDAGDNGVLPPSAIRDPQSHARRLDDPAIPDTGSGVPPVVDIGAYEGGMSAGLTVGPSPTVPEGGTVNLAVALGEDPGQSVQVDVARVAGDSDITVQAGATLVFDHSNYAMPQTVTLAAAEDSDSLPGQAIIRVAAPGQTVNVVAIEADNDPVASLLFVRAGATGANTGTSWVDALTDLQSALTLADQTGGAIHEIWVASGAYRPTSRANPSFPRSETFRLRNGLRLYGGFAGSETSRDARMPSTHLTVLSGDLSANDTTVSSTWSENALHVVTGSGTNASAVLDGFIVTGGNAAGTGENGYGGGIYNNAGSPTIANCTLLRNRTTGGYLASTRGAGMYNGNTSNPLISKCIFQENAAVGTVEYSAAGGGLFNASGSNPRLTSCTFVQNSVTNGDGGAVYNDQSQPEFLNCRFVANQTNGTSVRGGAICSSASAPRLSGCAFQGNSSSMYGGAVSNLNASNAIISCCVFTGNRGHFGGALYQFTSSPSIVNCTFYGNVANAEGGAIYDLSGAAPTLTNCILWKNSLLSPSGSGSQIYDSNSAAVVDYCCVQDGWLGAGGTAITTSDPLFMDPDGPDNLEGTYDDNVHLSGGSNCVNSGSNAAVASILLDADGNPRINAGIVDRGAYEQSIILTPGLVTVPEAGTADLTIWLASDPGAPVTLTVAFVSGDADLSTSSGGSLTFDPVNYASPQTVTLAAAEDMDFINGTALFHVSGLGPVPLAITVRESDNDVPPAVRVKADAPQGGDGSSWARALRTIEEGIDAVLASGGSTSEVWVAAGTYRPSRRTNPGDSRSATLQLVKNVAVYGGFAGTESLREQRDPNLNISLLSGDLNVDDAANFANNGDNCYHVVTANNVNDSAILDGFTISGGNATGAASNDGKGAGIFSYNGAPAIRRCVITDNNATNHAGFWLDNTNTASISDCTFRGNRSSQDGAGVGVNSALPTFTNCLFTGNTCGDEGGGIYLTSQFSRMTATDCRFENNTARTGGAITGTATVSRCKFVGNRATQSGGALSGGTMTVADCTFDGNSAAAGAGAASLGSLSVVKNSVFSANQCDATGTGAVSMTNSTLLNTLFTGNRTADAGGAVAGTGTLINCVFSGNAARTGGAIYTSYSGNVALKILNCTFSRNTASDRGGALYNYGASFNTPLISNSVFWDNLDISGNNTGSQIYSIGGNVTVSFSNVLGGFAGTGNTDQNPLFMDPDGADNLVGTIDDDLRLRPGAPGIDAGDNLAVPADTADLDQDGNTSEPTPLDFAGHARFVDDSQTTDRGNGNAPIVDMGALEHDFALLDVDADGDGLLDYQDNCPHVGNPDQADADADGSGDVCDACPLDPRNDMDGDGICGQIDNCPFTPNADQADSDGDGEGNVCEPTGILYVRAGATGANNGTNWANAFVSLQSALSAAAASGGAVRQIWVASGVYRPAGAGGSRSATFQLLNNVALYGGFAGNEMRADLRNPLLNVAILSGDLNANDQAGFVNITENSYHVVTAPSGLNSSAVLDGFTITGGNAGSGALSTNGGGLLIEASSPTIQRCRFVSNVSNNAGGGVAVVSNGFPSLLNCLFIANKSASGGGLVLFSSAGRILNCGFFGNTATGAAGAAYVSSVSPFVVPNALLFANCVFSGNTGDYSGGIGVNQSTFSLVGCTIYGNSANNSGGGLSTSSSGTTTLSGCIVWGNRDSSGTGTLAQIRTSSNAAIAVNYSCVQGGISGGIGNIASDPLFVNAAGADGVLGTEDDNLALRPQSPCVDAADTTALPLDPFDLDADGDTIERTPYDFKGNPRLLDCGSAVNHGAGSPPILDMGAWEQGIVVDAPNPIIVPEGGTVSFNVALSFRPARPIVINVTRASGDADIAVASGGTLVFDQTNFNIPQSVMLSATLDTDYLSGTSIIRIQPQGISGFDIVARENDSDAPAVLRVNASAATGGNGVAWSTAFRSLQDAIDAAIATNGAVKEIWVAAGNYRPTKRTDATNSRTATFRLANGVAFYGGFAGTESAREQRNPYLRLTVLSGDLNGNDGSNFSNNGENAYHVVTADGTDVSAVIDGFRVTAGNANGATHQSKGGGLYGNLGTPTIVGCTFQANAATSGAGLCFVGIGSQPVIRNCRFLSNNAPLGGGGGVYLEQSVNASLINCTFSRNAGGAFGAGLRVMASTCSLRNCVLWGDTTGKEINLYSGSNLAVHYSDVSGGVNGVSNDTSTLNWGTGNLNADPLFASAAGNDVRLTGPSPCIDAGDPASEYSLEPEPDGGRINMGAFGNTTEAEPRSWIYVERYNLVRGTRVGRTLFDYEFTVTARNASSQAASNVVLRLLQAGSNVQIVEDNVTVGSIAGSGTVTSTDTFTIRVDRTMPLSTLPISWQVSFNGGRTTLASSLELDLSTPVAADLNADGHVDENDLAMLLECRTGSAIPYTGTLSAECTLKPNNAGILPADFDGDGDVDQDDFGVFQRCFGGSQSPPACP